MGILRYGDPDNNPSDTLPIKGKLFHLDCITTDPTSAKSRSDQLEISGRHCEITKEYDSPETAKQHTDTRLGTTVYKIWKTPTAKMGRRRVKKSLKTKAKRCKCK